MLGIKKHAPNVNITYAAGDRGAGFAYNATEKLWYKYLAGKNHVNCIATKFAFNPKAVVGTALHGLIYAPHDHHRFWRYSHRHSFQVSLLRAHGVFDGGFVSFDDHREIDRRLPKDGRVLMTGGAKSGLVLFEHNDTSDYFEGYAYQVKGEEIVFHRIPRAMPWGKEAVAITGSAKVAAAVIDKQIWMFRLQRKRGWGVVNLSMQEEFAQLLKGNVAMTCLSSATPVSYTGALRGLLLKDGRMFGYNIISRNIELTEKTLAGGANIHIEGEKATLVGSSRYGLVFTGGNIYSYLSYGAEILYKRLEVFLHPPMEIEEQY